MILLCTCSSHWPIRHASARVTGLNSKMPNEHDYFQSKGPASASFNEEQTMEEVVIVHQSLLDVDHTLSPNSSGDSDEESVEKLPRHRLPKREKLERHKDSSNVFLKYIHERIENVK